MNSVNMNNASIVKPALIGGGAMGILSALPVLAYFNCVCCAWVIAGGILAGFLYIKESPFQVTMGRGAVVGLAAGAIGAIVCSLLFPLYLTLTDGGNAMIEQVRDAVSNPNLPEEVRQMIEDSIARGDLMRFFGIIHFLFDIVFYPLFAMLGGTIGVAIFEKRKPGNYQSGMIPPPNPPTDTHPPVLP